MSKIAIVLSSLASSNHIKRILYPSKKNHFSIPSTMNGYTHNIEIYEYNYNAHGGVGFSLSKTIWENCLTKRKDDYIKAIKMHLRSKKYEGIRTILIAYVKANKEYEAFELLKSLVGIVKYSVKVVIDKLIDNLEFIKGDLSFILIFVNSQENEIYVVSDKDTDIINYISNAQPNIRGDYRLSKKRVNKNIITTGLEGLEYLLLSIPA